MSYSDIRRLPVRYRRWFLDRLVSEFNRKAEQRKERKVVDRGDNRTIIQDLPMGEMNPTFQQTREKKFK